jgi:putative membrane protein
MMYNGYGWGGWVIGGLILLLILIAIVVIVALIVAAATRSRYGGGRMGKPEEQDPVRILKQRYAKGEVTKEEYDRMLDDLTKGQGGGAS